MSAGQSTGAEGATLLKRVYIETTFISYLTARPSRDVVIAGHRQTTHKWWDTRRESYELCASQLVLQEAAAGDPQAAQERLDDLRPMTFQETTNAALALAKELIQAGALPAKAGSDAFCARSGFKAPIICTPAGLLEAKP
jgi:hypothetical protein